MTSLHWVYDHGRDGRALLLIQDEEEEPNSFSKPVHSFVRKKMLCLPQTMCSVRRNGMVVPCLNSPFLLRFEKSDLLEFTHKSENQQHSAIKSSSTDHFRILFSQAIGIRQFIMRVAVK
jgi:hypothetical protein